MNNIWQENNFIYFMLLMYQLVIWYLSSGPTISGKLVRYTVPQGLKYVYTPHVCLECLLEVYSNKTHIMYSGSSHTLKSSSFTVKQNLSVKILLAWYWWSHKTYPLY